MTEVTGFRAAGPAGAAQCRAWAEEALELVRELYPVCRSITGDGVRQTLDRLGEIVTLDRREVPTGTAVFDWEIPREWNVREAWIKGPDGRKVVDFRDHSLHLVNYSMPFHGRMTLEALRPHLHSLPEHPEWIPYRTSYYSDYWGFCLRHVDLAALEPGDYEVLVDTTLAPGSLTYAEVLLRGRTDREVLVYTHTCHPSLANDNLSGMAIAAVLARALQGESLELSWRFVFGPGTIGSLAWLAEHRSNIDRIEHGLVIGLLGDRGRLTYKASRRGNAVVDRAARHLLPSLAVEVRFNDFEPYGYDERQFCSPGFNLPVGRLTRSSNGTYPEYHSSADNPDFLSVTHLAESIRALLGLFRVLDRNRTCRNLAPLGEPRLGKRGLYGALGGQSPGEIQQAMLWVLNQSDGQHDLLAIADRSGLPFEVIERAAALLENTDLLESLGPAGPGTGDGQ